MNISLAQLRAKLSAYNRDQVSGYRTPIDAWNVYRAIVGDPILDLEELKAIRTSASELAARIGKVEWTDGVQSTYSKIDAIKEIRERHWLGLRVAKDAIDSAKTALSQPVGTNTGHGHVWERPDGIKVRCGGPALCATCARDLARMGGQS